MDWDENHLPLHSRILYVHTSDEASLKYIEERVLNLTQTPKAPVTPISLASFSVDPRSQSVGEGTLASRTMTPTSAFKPSGSSQVLY